MSTSASLSRGWTGRMGSWLRERGSFRRQLILLAAVVSVVAGLCLVLIVQLVLAGLSTRTADEALANRTDTVVGSILATSTGSELRVPASVLDVGVAVYDASGDLVAGHPPTHLADDYSALRPGTTDTAGADEGTYRLLASEFRTRAGTVGRVVLAERLAPYEQTETYALWLSMAAGVLLVLAATAVAAWASQRVLRPVADMAGTAEDWSEHDLSRRFDMGPPTNEIRALAATLDGLLDKVADAIRTEQQLTSELAHELRTPLSIIMGSAELIAQRADLEPEVREDLDEIDGACRRMAATIAGLLELAKSGRVPGQGTAASLVTVLRDVLDHLSAEARLKAVLDEVPASAVVAAPAHLVVRSLMPVVENAVRVADHVRLSVELQGGSWLVHVDDDGPGLAPAVRGHAFEPGTTTGNGAGLGLSLARRIARAAGGDVLLGEAPDRWVTRFTIRLPRARVAS